MRAAKASAKKRRRLKRESPSSTTQGLLVNPTAQGPEPLERLDLQRHRWPLLIVLVVVAVSTVALYGRTLWELEYQWRTEADYSHGYLVPLLSLGLLYSRRDVFPGIARRFDWLGVGLLVLAVLMRTLGRLFFAEFLEGWSMVPWLAGCLALLAGRSAVWWAMPSIIFLGLMVPLPYQVETLLSWKLQSLVTVLSSAVLRILGFPAVSEGNTIWIGQSQMLVEEACSGLRIFVGMAAFAFFWAALIRRAWIDKFIVLASIIPLSIIANTVRSVIICISYHWFDGRWASLLHDWAGIFMILLAATMVWLVKEYWERVYRPVLVSMPGDRLRGYQNAFRTGKTEIGSGDL